MKQSGIRYTVSIIAAIIVMFVVFALSCFFGCEPDFYPSQQLAINTGYQEDIQDLKGDTSTLKQEVQFIQDYFTSSANDRRRENESQGRLIARTLYKQYGCTGDTMVVDYAWKVGGNSDKGLIHVVDTPFGSMLVDEAKIDINRLKEEPRCVDWKYLIDKDYIEYQQM